MEEILKRMIEQLQSTEWGEAQENVDGALAYLGCAVQNLRKASDGATGCAICGSTDPNIHVTEPHRSTGIPRH
jgi:hypothetical protein